MSSRTIMTPFALMLLLCGSVCWAQDQQPGQAQTQQPGQPQAQQPGQPQDQQPGQAQDQQPDQPQDTLPQAPILPVDEDAAGGGNRQMPAAAARALFGGAGTAAAVDTAIANDTNTLTGAESFAMGSPVDSHNEFDLALHTTTGADTGVVPGQTNLLFSAGALASLNHIWSRYKLTVQYAGSENLYRPDSTDDSSFQTLSLMQAIQWRRLTLRFRDDLVQSAGAAFGGFFSGGAFFTAPEGLATAVTPGFVPAQTILTGQVDRVANMTLGEADYSLSRNTDLTFAGSYGFLDFLTPGEIDSQNENVQIGYGHQIDRRNTLGIIYAYDAMQFGGTSGGIATHSGQAAYGRKLSSKASFQVSAGPQFVLDNAAGSSANQLSWSMYAVIKRQVRRTEFWASYSHGVTNGSGVLLGAVSNTFTGFAELNLSNTWLVSLTAGYATNSSLTPTGTTAPDTTVATGNGLYADWFSGLNVSRMWHRVLRTNFNYGLQRQTTSATGCPVLTCGQAALRQVVSVTVDFHIKPVSFE